MVAADTILVVDDDRGLREALEAILAQEGYKVTVACDGLEALDKLSLSLPRLIVLDMVMPRMDGFAFAQELERRGLRSKLPILLLTADARAGEKAARAHADDYLPKPFDIDQLLDKVSHLLPG